MRGHFASSNAPLLSSKTVEIVLLWSGAEYCKIFYTSFSSSREGIRSRIDWDRAMYSASVVESAISD